MIIDHLGLDCLQDREGLLLLSSPSHCLQQGEREREYGTRESGDGDGSNGNKGSEERTPSNKDTNKESMRPQYKKPKKST